MAGAKRPARSARARRVIRQVRKLLWLKVSQYAAREKEALGGDLLIEGELFRDDATDHVEAKDTIRERLRPARVWSYTVDLSSPRSHGQAVAGRRGMQQCVVLSLVDLEEDVEVAGCLIPPTLLDEAEPLRVTGQGP